MTPQKDFSSNSPRNLLEFTESPIAKVSTPMKSFGTPEASISQGNFLISNIEDLRASQRDLGFSPQSIADLRSRGLVKTN
ncbi:hypothetical protein HK096_007242, partial [Nowakowskiella sp. JEL0078]